MRIWPTTGLFIYLNVYLCICRWQDYQRTTAGISMQETPLLPPYHSQPVLSLLSWLIDWLMPARVLCTPSCFHRPWFNRVVNRSIASHQLSCDPLINILINQCIAPLVSSASHRHNHHLISSPKLNLLNEVPFVSWLHSALQHRPDLYQHMLALQATPSHWLLIT